MVLQFLRELRFIEAKMAESPTWQTPKLQFLRELRFIEAARALPHVGHVRGCSSFGNCASLRPQQGGGGQALF